MMEIFKNPFFIFPCLVFWINQFVEKSLGVFIPVYHSYGDDLMAMPVVFGLCLQVMRWMHPLKNELIFTKKQLMIALVYFSVVFELVLPAFSSAYTADLIDVACYGIGTLVFFRWVNRPALQSKKSLSN